MTKDPAIAAFLNLVIPGLGFIYNGKRKLFGAYIFLILFGLNLLFSLLTTYTKFAFLMTPFLFSLIYVTSFSVWAHREAKQINEAERAGREYQVSYPELKLWNISTLVIVLVLLISLDIWMSFASAESEKEAAKAKVSVSSIFPPSCESKYNRVSMDIRKTGNDTLEFSQIKIFIDDKEADDCRKTWNMSLGLEGFDRWVRISAVCNINLTSGDHTIKIAGPNNEDSASFNCKRPVD